MRHTSAPGERAVTARGPALVCTIALCAGCLGLPPGYPVDAADSDSNQADSSQSDSNQSRADGSGLSNSTGGPSTSVSTTDLTSDSGPNDETGATASTSGQPLDTTAGTTQETGTDEGPAVDQCADKVHNGDESAVDCGGSCPACPLGSGCTTPDDCDSNICTAAECDSPKCDEYEIGPEARGTFAFYPVRNWGESGWSPIAGTRYFDLDGLTFSTSVDEEGHALVVYDEEDNTMSLPELTSLSQSALTSAVLVREALALLPDDTTLALRSSVGDMYVTTSSSGLLDRVRSFLPLHRGVQDDNGMNSGWTGIGASHITADSHSTCHVASVPPLLCLSQSLGGCIAHICGNSDGMHWMPVNGSKNPISTGPGASGTLTLWVRPPETPTLSVRAVGTEGEDDDSFDGDDGQQYSEAELNLLDAVCVSANWCGNRRRDYDEDGVDCGGSCAPC